VSLPPDRRTSQRWRDAAQAVDAANGEYVLVAEDVSSNVAHRIMTGAIAAFRPAGAYHATTRRSLKTAKRVDVYAARVG